MNLMYVIYRHMLNRKQTCSLDIVSWILHFTDLWYRYAVLPSVFMLPSWDIFGDCGFQCFFSLQNGVQLFPCTLFMHFTYWAQQYTDQDMMLNFSWLRL